MDKTNFRKIDLAELLADGQKHLWETQQAYEQQVIAMALAREEYGDAVVAYEKSEAEEYVRAISREEGVTTARKMAEVASSELRAKMIRAEQNKKTIQGYCEATRERLQTIKILLRVDYGDVSHSGGR